MMRDLPGAKRRLARRAAVGIADLGRDLRQLAELRPLSAQPFAEHGLARAAAVGIGGIEPPKPHAPRMVQQLQRLFLAVARMAQPGRGAHATEIAAAEPDALKVGCRQQIISLLIVPKCKYSVRAELVEALPFF